MENVDDDVLWRILQLLSPVEACASRAVARRLRQLVDGVPQHEWKRIYHERVCDSLVVGDEFDWKRAACLASHGSSIAAVCLWNFKSVYLISPWIDSQTTVETPLKNGVERGSLLDVAAVEFVYDNTFRLRGMAQTCIRRSEQTMCRNCRTASKQRCLNLQYRYYLRELPCLSADEPAFNECLGLRLAAHPYGE